MLRVKMKERSDGQDKYWLSFSFLFIYLSQKHDRDKDDIVKQNEDIKADNRYHKITNVVIYVAIPPVLICEQKWQMKQERNERGRGGGAKPSAELMQRGEFGAYIVEDKATAWKVELVAGRRSKK